MATPNVEKPGITVSIAGHGELRFRHVVSDDTGTLSYRGKLVAGVDDRLRALAQRVDVHILTADTRGTAGVQLSGLPLQVRRLVATNEDVQKRDYTPTRGRQFTGTYSINNDCSGTVNLVDAQGKGIANMDLVISNGGKDVALVGYDTGFIL